MQYCLSVVFFSVPLCGRYSTRKNLLGFELLNEPSHDIEALNHDKLEGFYVAGYDIIRKYSSTCLVVFNELYSEYYDIWKNFAKEPAFYNVVCLL